LIKAEPDILLKIKGGYPIKIENWELRIENGEWRMENGEVRGPRKIADFLGLRGRIENWELRIENGEWKIENANEVSPTTRRKRNG
jgi:hypothetical protein